MPWTKLQADAVRFAAPPEDGGRVISVKDALLEAQQQALEQDPAVIIMGEGVDDAGGIFGTTIGLHERYGTSRVIDLPIAENACTGIAIGAALTGLRPIFVHQRVDFMLMCMDQIVNHAAKWRAMFNEHQRVPLVIRAIIGRGWGSAAQHSQSLLPLFAHIPGLKVVMPYGACDTKGLLLSSIADNDPVIFLEHRWNYNQKEHVPPEIYSIPFGQALVRRHGTDITIAAVSFMVHEALDAAQQLAASGIQAEVIDMRTVRPLDLPALVNSVRKTRHLLVADGDHLFCGWSAEVAAAVTEQAFDDLCAPVARIGLPEIACPASPTLEQAFYPTARTIADRARSLLRTTSQQRIHACHS